MSAPTLSEALGVGGAPSLPEALGLGAPWRSDPQPTQEVLTWLLWL